MGKFKLLLVSMFFLQAGCVSFDPTRDAEKFEIANKSSADPGRSSAEIEIADPGNYASQISDLPKPPYVDIKPGNISETCLFLSL